MFRRTLAVFLPDVRGRLQSVAIYPSSFIDRSTGKRVECFNHMYTMEDGLTYQMLWEKRDSPQFKPGTTIGFTYLEKERQGSLIKAIRYGTLHLLSQASDVTITTSTSSGKPQPSSAPSQSAWRRAEGENCGFEATAEVRQRRWAVETAVAAAGCLPRAPSAVETSVGLVEVARRLQHYIATGEELGSVEKKAVTTKASDHLNKEKDAPERD